MNQRELSAKYPAVQVKGLELHIVDDNGQWEVWVNPEGGDWTGTVVGHGDTRQEAVRMAVETLEALTDHLQGPPW